MSILIKGMEMPTGCSGCPIDSDICTLWQELPPEKLRDTRPAECPLVPVPPHGPLIDMNDFLSEWSELESYRTAMRLCEVIPAEEGET